MPTNVDRGVGHGCLRAGIRIIAALRAQAAEISRAFDLAAPDAFVCGQRCSLVQTRV
jgi:hypothetical protein